ncbi:MAG: AAA family ATPase [Candidatus Daviesbacteria bacterium]|nr:AAA family ATPase [Candidatus Daviesbacteria bacterium]
MKLVIGLVGEKGSGKQTFVNFLKAILPNLNIRQIRISDILAQTLILWDIPISRANEQKLAFIMNNTFGQTSLAHAAKFSAEDNHSDIVIFDGIRKKSEMNLVKKMPNSLILYITAEQKLRFKRLRKRSEKVGEAGLTFEQFLLEEGNIREKDIPHLGKEADIELENNNSLAEYKMKIKDFCKNKLLQAAAAVSS